MRFVPTDILETDMMIGKTIYTTDGNVLLQAGVTLTEQYITRIKLLNISGVYINDGLLEYSELDKANAKKSAAIQKGIEINDAIGNILRKFNISKAKELSKGIEVQEVVSKAVRNTAVDKVKTIFQNLDSDETVEESYSDIKDVMSNVLDEIMNHRTTVVNMIDFKQYDDYTFQHSVNVAILSLVIGTSFGFDRPRLTSLGYAALFHDIGKMRIQKSILNKPQKLNYSEQQQMHEHPAYSFEIMKELFPDLWPDTYAAALQHHEKVNGTGYPNRLPGKSIGIHAKIISVCDVYDALISDRSYRKALPPSEAIEYIMANSDIHFDHHIVKAFTKKVAAYPVGTTVQLSDGSIGLVMENYANCIARPQVMIVNGKDTYCINLNDPRYSNITIVSIVA